MQLSFPNSQILDTIWEDTVWIWLSRETQVESVECSSVKECWRTGTDFHNMSWKHRLPMPSRTHLTSYGREIWTFKASASPPITSQVQVQVSRSPKNRTVRSKTGHLATLFAIVQRNKVSCHRQRARASWAIGSLWNRSNRIQLTSITPRLVSYLVSYIPVASYAMFLRTEVIPALARK